MTDIISIASNRASLAAQGQLQRTTTGIGKTFERLSSGLRISSGGDDPAGIVIAESLRTDVGIATAAIRNTSDGISITSIVDSALGEIGSILGRMSELAEQSANGTYSNTQRSALSTEFLALGSEVERISRTTEFNSMTLLSNSSSVTLQVGLDGNRDSQIIMPGVLGTLSSLGLASTGASKLTYSLITVSEAGSQDASQNALDAITTAISTLTMNRGKVGATESRLSFALNYLTSARETFSQAASRIRDADVAQEVAEMTRLQILQEAGTAVLAQANQQPQIALALLR